VPGNVSKPDMLDAKGLAKLLHLDSLPTVCLPPRDVRDAKELQPGRMALSKRKTALTSSQRPLGRTTCALPWPHLP